MAVSTRDEGVHKHSSPARSMLDGPQQSAPDGASPQHSAGAHCSTGTDRCGALLVLSPSASHGTSPRVPLHMPLNKHWSSGCARGLALYCTYTVVCM